MKCVNCEHEQDKGNFCRRCGTALQGVDELQAEKEVVSQSETEAATTTSQSVVPPLRKPAPAAQPSGGGSFVKEFLNFDKMITPSIIKFVFWIGSGLTILSGLIMMISGAASSYGGGIQVFLGILTILIGPFVIRIYCELLILFFKIHETLQEINKRNSINS